MITKIFKELSKENVDTAGGKGASLGELTQGGVPVPPGFVVLTHAFEHFLDETDLRQEVRALLSNVDSSAIHTAERASEQIQNLIITAKIPEDRVKEIQQSFKELNAEFVAVRSSATAEDGAENAWAGQLDSFLNTTEDTLIKNVQKCWASLFTPRAIFYRIEKGLKESHVSVAVVVQKMVESTSSGIAFSVHPVTEDSNQLIIEAGFGLGEAIVSGSITPDSYVIEKEPRHIIDINVAEQKRGIFRKQTGGGSEWRDIPSEQGSKQVLTDEEILELSELVVKIENHYGFPCDIEWAREGGKFYIVQSRPITTLQPKPINMNVHEVGKENDQTVLQFVRDHTWNKIVSREMSLFELNCAARAYTMFSFERVLDSVVVGEKGMATRYCIQAQLEQLRDDIRTIPMRDVLCTCLDTDKKFFHYLTTCNVDNNFNLGEFIEHYTTSWLGELLGYYVGEYSDDDEAIALSKQLRGTQNAQHLASAEFVPKVLSHASQQHGLSAQEASLVLPEELVRGSVKQDIIKERGLSYALVTQESKLQLLAGDDALVVAQCIVSDSDQIRKDIFNSTVILGTTAYAGRTQGVVRIVNTNEQARKFIDGEVLVSVMTRTTLAHVIGKASAIVTDEGGITSHAAIVSRELGKPCIIGTKIATKVLQDGDLVEVDADKGVIRFLERMGEKFGTNDALVKEISTLTWFKSWEARFPLFSVTIGAPGYFQPLKDEFGFELKHFLVTTHEGTLAGFWVEKELLAFGEHLAKCAEKNPAIVATWAKRLKQETDKFRTLMHKGAEYFLSQDNLRVLRRSDEMLSAYQIAVREVINYLPDTLRERYVEDLQGARKYSETIFFELSEIVTSILTLVAQKEDVLVHLVGCMTGDELEEYLSEGKLQDKAILENRYLCSGFINHPEFTWLSGEEVLSIENSFLKNYTGELKGQTSHKGRVTGGVRVIKNFSAAASLIKGDILVTGMTDPNFVPIMERAGAIVTDAGGMLCHAAIVSRELKKPCIIGTKIATQVLHDGDLVEVDADKGVVRVLERAVE